MYSVQARTKTLNYTKLADLEQEEEENPGKFLDRLWEAHHKFPDVDPENAEGEMILKDRFVTQLAPDIWCILQKQEFGPNQSLKKNCGSWLRWYIMVENMRRKRAKENQAMNWSPNNGC